MNGETVVRIVRSVGSVVAGLGAATVVVVVMTWVAVVLMFGGDMTADPTTPYLAINLAYSFGAAVLGGWVAARIAAHRPFLHAGIVAAVMLVLAVLGDGGPPDAGVPAWYGPGVGTLGAAGALVGGWLRVRSLRGAGEGAAVPD